MTLRFLNLNAHIQETIGSLSIWRASPLFANPNQQINILHIRSRVTADQLREAGDRIGTNKDYALISTIQDVDRLKNRLSEMGFANVSTVREILCNGIKQLLGKHRPLGLPRATIEPILTDKVSKYTAQSTLHIRGWLEKEADLPLSIITGPAGFGKTTLCQILVNHFIKYSELTRIPLFISSQHWRNLLETHHLTIRQIFLAAVSERFSQAALGDEMIEHLISSGAIIPIFDGLDEICTDAYTEIGISEIVDQLDEMFSDNEQARAVFTSRTTFWTMVRPDVRLRFREFVVRPFDSNQRSQFLDDWFGSDHTAKSRVFSLLGRIEALGSGPSRSQDEGTFKFSESPYVIYLASIAAEEQKGGGFGPDSWANIQDPLDAILTALAEREVRKNKIPAAKQNRILFSLALLHGPEFSLDAFSQIVDLYAEPGERLEGMLSHHVITGSGSSRTFLFDGFGDYLRAKAIANWIFRDENEIFGIEEYLKEINSESDTSVDIFGEISAFYASLDDLKQAFSSKRIIKFFHGRMGQGLLFLFSRAFRKQDPSSHLILTDAIIETLLGGERFFRQIDFSGQIERISLSALSFEDCKFSNVVFRSCDFDAESKFVKCDFRNDFAVYSCDGFGDAQLLSDQLSSSARAVFAERNVKGADRRVTETDITAILEYIFSQMQTPQLGYRDISREGLLSRIQKKNSYIAGTVLEMLEREDVLIVTRAQQKHRVRLGIGKPEDVIAFHREGALIRSIRNVVDNVLGKYD